MGNSTSSLLNRGNSEQCPCKFIFAASHLRTHTNMVHDSCDVLDIIAKGSSHNVGTSSQAIDSINIKQ